MLEVKVNNEEVGRWFIGPWGKTFKLEVSIADDRAAEGKQCFQLCVGSKTATLSKENFWRQSVEVPVTARFSRQFISVEVFRLEETEAGEKERGSRLSAVRLECLPRVGAVVGSSLLVGATVGALLWRHELLFLLPEDRRVSMLSTLLGGGALAALVAIIRDALNRDAVPSFGIGRRFWRTSALAVLTLLFATLVPRMCIVRIHNSAASPAVLTTAGGEHTIDAAGDLALVTSERGLKAALEAGGGKGRFEIRAADGSDTNDGAGWTQPRMRWIHCVELLWEGLGTDAVHVEQRLEGLGRGRSLDDAEGCKSASTAEASAWVRIGTSPTRYRVRYPWTRSTAENRVTYLFAWPQAHHAPTAGMKFEVVMPDAASHVERAELPLDPAGGNAGLELPRSRHDLATYRFGPLEMADVAQSYATFLCRHGESGSVHAELLRVEEIDDDLRGLTWTEGAVQSTWSPNPDAPYLPELAAVCRPPSLTAAAEVTVSLADNARVDPAWSLTLPGVSSVTAKVRRGGQTLGTLSCGLTDPAVEPPANLQIRPLEIRLSGDRTPIRGGTLSGVEVDNKISSTWSPRTNATAWICVDPTEEGNTIAQFELPIPGDPRKEHVVDTQPMGTFVSAVRKAKPTGATSETKRRRPCYFRKHRYSELYAKKASDCCCRREIATARALHKECGPMFLCQPNKGGTCPPCS